MSAAWKRRFVRILPLTIVVVAIVALAAMRAGSALVRTRAVGEPDAILVLASHEWERLPEAAQRARQVPTAAVLLSVPRHITGRNCYRCAERSQWLEALGVSPTRVMLLPQRVANTREEALAALAFCRERGVRRLLVVTSPYHTRRTLATFDWIFVDSGVQVGVQPSSAYSVARPDRWWGTPYDRSYVRYEWGALAFYFVRYGIIPGP